MNGFVHVGRDDEGGVEGAPSAAREGDAHDTHLRNWINGCKTGFKVKRGYACDTSTPAAAATAWRNCGSMRSNWACGTG